MRAFFQRPFRIGLTYFTTLTFGSYQRKKYQLKKLNYNLNIVRAQSWFSRSSEPKPNSFTFGSFNIPHPKKAEKGGEDACFANEQLLCVADGVGSWNNLGIDTALYSRELVQNVADLFLKNVNKYLVDTEQLMNDAVNKATKFGSSTLVITTLDPKKPVIYGSNLGDSGYLIFRFKKDGDGRLPISCCHEVQNNDIVVVASDGVLDNLFTKDIIDLIKKQTLSKLTTNEGVNELAKQIAEESFRLSQKKDYHSPFAKACKECVDPKLWRIPEEKYKPEHEGGKPDDITIVIGRVNISK